MRISLLHILLFIFLISSCNIGDVQQTVKEDAVEHIESDKADDVEVPTTQEQGRTSWQKPNLVINKLGDISEKVIADIGAGSGYFSFRLVPKASKVIAIDIDPMMIDMMDQFSKELSQLYASRFETRLATPTESKLNNAEVDHILIVNTLAYIDDKKAYLESLASKLKEGGSILIMDFKMKRIDEHLAPSTEYRMHLSDVEQVLIDAGYTLTESDDQSLKYQYIVIAEK